MSNSSRPPFRVAVVGADPTGRGFGARAHVGAVRALPSLDLAAVCTSRPETASAAAAAYDVPQSFSDYNRLLADDEIDLVTIAVRVRLHLEIAAAALEAGKMVYCEWPLCLNAADAHRLATLARALGVATAAGLQGRFAPAVAYARQLIDNGEIGRPLSFVATQLLNRFALESDHSWLAREDEGSGALHVATGHVTDLVEYLLGRIEAVAGTRATMLPRGTYADTGRPVHWTASDIVSYTAKVRHGCLGTIYTTYLCDPPEGFSLRVIGDAGHLLLRGPGYVSFAPAALSVRRHDDAGSRRLPIPHRFFGGLQLDPGDAAFNVAMALAAFTEAAATGERFRPDFEDAAHIHEVLEDIASTPLHRVGCGSRRPRRAGRRPRRRSP